jgi:hypothetical protein
MGSYGSGGVNAHRPAEDGLHRQRVVHHHVQMSAVAEHKLGGAVGPVHAVAEAVQRVEHPLARPRVFREDVPQRSGAS